MLYRKTKFIILTVLILFIVFTTTSFFTISAKNEVEFKNEEENKARNNIYVISPYESDIKNTYKNNSYAYIYQNGNKNYTYISQKKSMNNIENNEAEVYQLGNDNYSFVEQ